MAVSHRGYVLHADFLICFTPGIVTLMDTTGLAAWDILRHYPGVSCTKEIGGEPKGGLQARQCQELQGQSSNTQSQAKKLDNN